jgi:hypothetical protein
MTTDILKRSFEPINHIGEYCPASKKTEIMLPTISSCLPEYKSIIDEYDGIGAFLLKNDLQGLSIIQESHSRLGSNESGLVSFIQQRQ